MSSSNFNISITNTTNLDDYVPFLIQKENKEMLIKVVDDLIKKNKAHLLKELIEKIEEHLGYSLNSNVDKLIANYQEAVVFPLKHNTPKYPRSGRPITKMSKILTKGIKPKQSLRILNDFYVDSNCFCLNIPIGPINEPVYIPIIRFAQSNASGYYGATINSDANFTWYYIEPDSNYLLLSKKTFVARNKIQAFLLLCKMKNDETHYLYSTAMKLISDYLCEISFYDDLSDDKILELFLSNEEIKLVGNYTNYFRKILDISNKSGGGTKGTQKQKGIIFYGTGGMDIFDEDITELAREQGYDVLILTHQSGNSARLVGELVDTRLRSESLDNIYS